MVIVIAYIVVYIVVVYFVNTKIILIILNIVQVHPEEGSPCRASFVVVFICMVIVIAYIVVAYIVDTKIILIIVNTVQVHPEEGSPCRASFVGDESEKQSRLGSIKAVILDTYIILIY